MFSLPHRQKTSPDTDTDPNPEQIFLILRAECYLWLSLLSNRDKGIMTALPPPQIRSTGRDDSASSPMYPGCSQIHITDSGGLGWCIDLVGWGYEVMGKTTTKELAEEFVRYHSGAEEVGRAMETWSKDENGFDVEVEKEWC